MDLTQIDLSTQVLQIMKLLYLFLAGTAALEVQMLVCVCVHHTCYNCTGLLKDLLRTSEGILKDF